MLTKRPTIKELVKLTHTKGFFLTTYFGNHPKCVAIESEKLGKRWSNMLHRQYCVWERDGTLYITNKGKEYE